MTHQSDSVLRPIRSMGVEYVKPDDPTKVHGVIVESGESMWRAECMACGIQLKLHGTPGPARVAAIRHADSSGHHAALFIARWSQP